jgi:hypothetical protein
MKLTGGRGSRGQGRLEGAGTLYERALAIFWELSDRWGIAGTLAGLGTQRGKSGTIPSLDAERSPRLAGAAAVLRQNIGASLPPAKHAKLEAALTTGSAKLVRRLCVAGRESC